MNVLTLARLGMKHLGSAVWEELYLRTGYDASRPVAIHALVNERCNAKCLFCEDWRLPGYCQEMTIQQWQAALMSLRDFIGRYSISLSGGEPFIRKGFLDLLEFCRDNAIHAGVTTNGSCFTEDAVKRLVAARPFNVNVSVDAPNAEVHDYLRGVSGLFERLSAGIRRLRHERDARRAGFPIIIKPTVTARNFRLMPELVRWAQQAGATSVHLQPLSRWTPETYGELWVEQADQAELEGVIEQLIAMKKEGAPILNTAEILRLFVRHFREDKAPPEVLPCRVGLRNFFIYPNGDVRLCFYFPVVGNLSEHSARDIWFSDKAREVRRQIRQCRKLCLMTCLSQKTIGQKIRMALGLLKSGAGRAGDAP